MPHKPVLLKQVLEYLNLKPGAVVVDGTLGNGGHSTEILKHIGREGKLIALDQDPISLKKAENRFSDHPQISFHHSNFRNTPNILDKLNISAVDAVILDIGISSDQLDDSDRGFSFMHDGPLDMRMDTSQGSPASELIQDLSQEELADIFWKLGEERNSRRYAKAICESRDREAITTTGELAQVIERSLGYKKSSAGNRPERFRRHPATRVFQALRIAVNDELNALKDGLKAIWERVAVGGRFCVISFHSLEDRIVKHQFISWKQDGNARILTKKPIIPEEDELRENPRSRSSKLRVVERIQ